VAGGCFFVGNFCEGLVKKPMWYKNKPIPKKDEPNKVNFRPITRKNKPIYLRIPAIRPILFPAASLFYHKKKPLFIECK
jgi:hypothetical protein